MRRIFLGFVFCLITGTVAKADMPLDPSWSSCKTDADCTAGIADCCFTWKPVNKNHTNDLINARLNTICTACAGPRGNQPETLCIDQQCEMTDKETGLTPSEWESQHGIKYSGGIYLENPSDNKQWKK